MSNLMLLTFSTTVPIIPQLKLEYQQQVPGLKLENKQSPQYLPPFVKISLNKGTQRPVFAAPVSDKKLRQFGSQSTIEDWWDMTISKVILSSGKQGFLTSKPNNSLKLEFKYTFLAQMSCMRATEAKLLDKEAIFATVELSIGQLLLFFSPMLKLQMIYLSLVTCNWIPLRKRLFRSYVRLLSASVLKSAKARAKNNDNRRIFIYQIYS